MKNSRSRLVLLFLVLAFILTQCRDNATSVEGPQVEYLDELPEGFISAASTIPEDPGAVGVEIDTRPIVRKGYNPVVVQVDFPEPFSSYSSELSVDPFTDVAVLSIPAGNLTANEIRELNRGIDADIRVFDDASQELAVYNDIVRVNFSNNPLVMETGLPAIYPELTFTEGVPYIIQAITEDPETSNKTFRVVERLLPSHGDYGRIILDDFTGSAEDLFYFNRLSTNSFHVLMRLTPLVGFRLLETPGSPDFRHMGTFWDQGANPVLLTRDEDGLSQMAIDTEGGAAVRHLRTSDGEFLAAPVGAPDGEYLPLRIVAANITWEVEDLGTDFTPPKITPSIKTEFAYRAVLENCSDRVTLTERLTRTETRTRSYTVATEESLELFSSHETSVGITVGAEAGFSLFGAGATASAETSTGYTYTTSATDRTTNTWEQTVEEEVAVSTERTVELPPLTVVEVFDAIQGVDNVRMPFVQTLRVRGRRDDGEQLLSGREITSQLLANQFGGVVSRVGSNFVDITTKGTVTFNSFFDVRRSVTPYDAEEHCANN